MLREIPAIRAMLDEALVGLVEAKRRLLERIALHEQRGGPLPPLLIAGPPGTGKDALIRAAAEAWAGEIPRAALERLDPAARAEAAGRALDAADAGLLAIATAHHPAELPPERAHRFEVVCLPGYGREEKGEIARRALLPRALRAVGPSGERVIVTAGAVERLVRDYSPEAGVHGLEARLSEVVRRAAARVALEEARSVQVDEDEVARLLGPARREGGPGAAAAESGARAAEVGVVQALTWTRTGGATVLVEALRSPDARPPFAPTPAPLAGAVETALAFIRARAGALRIDPEALRASDIVLRATGPAPFVEDGGLDLAAFMAVVSLATDRPVRPDIALAGALTLRGAAVSTPGAAEKILAAERAGLRQVIVPLADFAAIQAALPPSTLAAVEIVPVRHAEDAARHALIDIVIARGIA